MAAQTRPHLQTTTTVLTPTVMNDSPDGNGQWILGVSRKDDVRDVAAQTIKSRVRSVEHYLPLAATVPDEDIEYVHQLRVATRRAVAAIELYQHLLSGSDSRKLCRLLKKVRRAAGTARDCDVMIERYSSKQASAGQRKLLKMVQKRRAAAQQPLRDVNQELSKSHQLRTLTRRVRAATKHSDDGDRKLRFDRWARQKLRKRVQAFFRAEPSDLENMESLHEFRLRGKDLRYAVELMAAAFPSRLRNELYPVIKQLQDRLGVINDHAVACARFKRWRKDSNNRKRRRRFLQQWQREQEALDQAIWEFARWWTARRSKWIQKRFRSLINGHA